MNFADEDLNHDLPPLPIPPPKSAPPSPFNSQTEHIESDSQRSSLFTDSHGRGRESKRLKDSTEKKTIELIHQLRLQLELETRRADEADRRTREVVGHLRNINEARMAALTDAARANEELKLYKIQLDIAQREIYRAQDVLQVVDRQRHQAEKEAAKGRSTIRKLNEDKVIREAREEGRRIGMQEGLARGRDLGIEEGRILAYEETRSVNGTLYADADDEPEYTPLSTVDLNAPEFPTRLPLSPPQVRRMESPPLATPPPVPAPVPPMGSFTPRPPFAAGVASTDQSRRSSLRNPALTPRSLNIAIPPDNFIPELDSDGRVRLPPPHEFSKTPTSAASVENDEPLMVPRPRSNSSHRMRGTVRDSSPESESTAWSQLDIIQGPLLEGRGTPMSVIHEVPSTQTSPNPQSLNGGHSLQHQSSFSPSGHVNTHATPQSFTSAQDHTLRQQRSTVSATSSAPRHNLRPTPSNQDTRFSSGTLPDINIQPPSRSPSMSTGNSFDQYAGGSLGSRDHHASSSKGSTGYSPNHPQTNGIPGGYVNPYIDEDPGAGPSVLPNPRLYRNDADDDAVSSGMESLDTLTTPPGKQAGLDAAWTGVSQRAAQVPLPPSTVAGSEWGTSRSRKAGSRSSRG